MPGDVTEIVELPTYTEPRHWPLAAMPSRYCQLLALLLPPLWTIVWLEPIRAAGLAHASIEKSAPKLRLAALATET